MAMKVAEREKLDKQAVRLLQRKKGALTAELMEKLNLSRGQVVTLLRRLGAKGEPAGLGGKLGKALRYRLDK